MSGSTFEDRVASAMAALSPAERQVTRFFRQNRELVLVASAAELAERVGTSDATVVRTTKSIGYAGLDELRRQLAKELRSDLSPASRMARTLGDVSNSPSSAFDVTLDIHAKALGDLRRDITAALFDEAVEALTRAGRVRIFGIGPSSALADYFAIQLARLGVAAGSLKQTGLLLADELQALKKGDLLVVLAYSRIYPELAVLLDRADELDIGKILMTDTLGAALRSRVELVLPVERGKADNLSMHTATLALMEALLVGVAARRPTETISSLELLNELRARIAGKAMDLPIAARKRGTRGGRKSPVSRKAR